MPNHLIHENSPYLIQHADNPVDWHPWITPTLELAVREDKPIFLSIGYAACHWCHVMAHESFEDPGIAAIMNEYFINIKVDREERPDLDSLYMNAVVAMTGQGGWPMSVFLTPKGEPFFGGTYFPPVRRFNMPAFREVLASVAQAWKTERAQIDQSSRTLTDHLKQTLYHTNQGEPLILRQQVLDQAKATLVQNYDWEYGGWGGAPKFPQPMSIDFLLGRAIKGDQEAVDIATHALQHMARGGIYDVVGGGFSRYSTDVQWLVPHFEKMLYDNAQLARVYLHGYLVTKDPAYRRICIETLDFVQRELLDEQGGFYSSLDADSDGEEGKFYLWTLDELKNALGEPEKVSFILTAYGVTRAGNFEGHTVLQQTVDNAELAKRFNLEISQVQEKLTEYHKLLLGRRSSRIRPATDDKVLVSWNALMLITFAEAGRYLGRDDYLETARCNARFLLGSLIHPAAAESTTKGNASELHLYRSWRKGKAQHNAYLEDYAGLILGLLALYQSDPDPTWFEAANRLTKTLTTHFSDPQGGFFDTRDDHENLFLRPKDSQDNATPSGGAMACLALLQMASLTGNRHWRDQAELALSGIQNIIGRYPTAYAFWLSSLAFSIGPVYEVAILGDPSDPRTQALFQAVNKHFIPNMVLASSSYPPNVGVPELLLDRPLINHQPSAYVCQDFMCKTPANTAEELSQQLNAVFHQ